VVDLCGVIDNVIKCLINGCQRAILWTRIFSLTSVDWSSNSLIMRGVLEAHIRSGLDSRDGGSNHSLMISGSLDKALLVILAREHRHEFFSALYKRADPIFTDFSVTVLRKKCKGPSHEHTVALV
jgi:hypothetical protein